MKSAGSTAYSSSSAPSRSRAPRLAHCARTRTRPSLTEITADHGTRSVAAARRPPASSHGLPDVLAVEAETRAERALPDEELVHAVRRAEPGKRRTVAHESHIAHVPDAFTAFGDHLGCQQLTQPHDALPESSTRSRRAPSLHCGCSRARSGRAASVTSVPMPVTNSNGTRAGPESGSSCSRRWSTAIHRPRRPPTRPASAPGPDRMATAVGTPSSSNSSSRSSTLPARKPSRIDQLAVEQLQPGEQFSGDLRVAHEPALVDDHQGNRRDRHDREQHHVDSSRSCSGTGRSPCHPCSRGRWRSRGSGST